MSSNAYAVRADDEVVDRQIGDYCSITKGEKKSLGEMESDFLAALQSFYFDGQPLMSNEEFDNLKEELQWQGSKVVIMSEAHQAAQRSRSRSGQPGPFDGGGFIWNNQNVQALVSHVLVKRLLCRSVLCALALPDVGAGSRVQVRRSRSSWRHPRPTSQGNHSSPMRSLMHSKTNSRLAHHQILPPELILESCVRQ